MPSFGRKVFLIFQKDLKEELRTADHLLSTLIFGAMLVFVISFSLQIAAVDAERIFPALLWISIFFMATLALQRAMVKEKDSGALDALLLATGERSIFFYAKFLSSFTVLVLLELVVIPLLWIFVEVRTTQAELWYFVLSILLGSWGLAAVGSLLNAITMQLPNARLLFPILMFPILIPLLLAAILCTQGALMGETSSVLGWLYLMLVYNLVFTIVPLFLFDYILEG